MTIARIALSWGLLLFATNPSHGAPPAPPSPPKPPGAPRPAGAPATPTQRPTASRFRGREEFNRSLETAEADFYCLDGFQLNVETRRCENLDESRAQFGCPSGFDFKDGMCSTSSVTPAARFCPDDYVETLGRCLRILKAPKQLVCPPAYAHGPFGCVKDVETDPIIKCSKGLLQHGKCIDIFRSRAVPMCTPGFELSGNVCARRQLEGVEFRCPAGYIKKDDMCVQHVSQRPTKECPSNAMRSGNLCVVNQMIPAIQRCQNGEKAVDGFCAERRTIEPVSKCPPMTEAAGDVCIREEIAEPRIDCPDGSAPSADKICGNGKHSLPAAKSCPPGFELINKGTCHRKSAEPLQPSCPTGFALVGAVCVAVDYVPPGTFCPEGSQQIAEGCLVEETFPAQDECPNGQTLDATTGLCLTENQVPATPFCVNGTYDPKNQACSSAEVVPLASACPPNSRETVEAGEKICLEEQISAPNMECPADFTLRGDACFGRALADGKLTCTTPYTDAGDDCEFKEVIPKIIGCPNGGILKDTSCIRPSSQPATVMCPEGYTYKQDSQMCGKLLWSRPIPICPPGFTYDNLVMRCYRISQGGSTPKPGDEDLLPLEVQSGTTTTTKTVKAKIQPPPQGKEQFIPIQTFTGPDAVKQAQNLETVKLMNAAAGNNPPKPVYVPPV